MSGSEASDRTEGADVQMSAYLDGELSASESAAFEAFLDDEPDARDELDGMRKLLGALGNLPEPEAPPDLYDSVHRRLRREKVRGDGLLGALVSLPFQVLSIVIILAAAAVFLMAELDRERHELDKSAPSEPAEASEPPGDGEGQPPLDPNVPPLAIPLE